jgi:hypothetical protein
MTGGLLQLVTSGQEDVYLTIKPQITFFKKVYYRHTNFATELRQIFPDQQAEFGENITFTLDNNGDALYKCYLQIDLPILSFSNNSITDTHYTTMINNIQSRLNNNISNYTNSYTTLKSYVDIVIILYRQLKSSIAINNITITNLQNIVQTFNNQYSVKINQTKSNIDINVYQMINIPQYILNINQLIGPKDTVTTITVQTISTNLDNLYNAMIYWLKYYYNLIQVNTNQLNNTNLNFNWAEYLGHNFFTYFRLDVGGVEIMSYDNDYLHIQQTHTVKQEYQDNYYKMIGNIPELNTFNNQPKGGNKIIVPLLFWFCKDIGSSLPLIAMQYQTVTITTRVNKINKIICFENWGQMYNNLLIVTEYYDYNNITINSNLVYSKYNIDLDNKMITYNCTIVNSTLLQNKYPNLSGDDINYILSFGTDDTINQNQWIYFMTQINQTLSIKMELYNSFINYNLLYSQIELPNITLLGEYIFMDEIERVKFATSKLEYIIENIDMDIYNVTSQPVFNCELSFTKPVKELYWYIQPNIFTIGLSQYGQNTDLLYDVSSYLPNIISTQSLKLDQYEILFVRAPNGYQSSSSSQPNQNDLNYYFNMLPYKYLNNNLPSGVYYHTFSLYPEETQPSGTANFSIVKSKQYNITINSNFIDSYYNNTDINNLNLNNTNMTLKFISKAYNIFVVERGRAELLFTL